MMQKLFGVNWDVRLGGILTVLGAACEFLYQSNTFVNTPYGKWVALLAYLYTQFKIKSNAVTGTGRGAARVADVNNVPIAQNPN